MTNSTNSNSETVVGLKPKGKRGFASMDSEKQRMIARKGGKAAHEKGTAHEWSSSEARDAGRKGGARSVKESSAPVRTRTTIMHASDIVIGAPIFSTRESSTVSSPGQITALRTAVAFTTPNIEA